MFKKDKQIRLAKSALDLNANEAFTQAMQQLGEAYVQVWRETSPRDEEAREKCYLAVNVLGKIEQHLEEYIFDGKMHEADAKAAKKRIKKDFK